MTKRKNKQQQPQAPKNIFKFKYIHYIPISSQSIVSNPLSVSTLTPIALSGNHFVILSFWFPFLLRSTSSVYLYQIPSFLLFTVHFLFPSSFPILHLYSHSIRILMCILTLISFLIQFYILLNI